MTSAGKRWPQWRLRDWLISPACTGQPNPAILSQRDNARHQHHRQRGREVYARKVYALHAPEVECIDKSLPLAEPGVSLNTLVTSPKGCKFARNRGSSLFGLLRSSTISLFAPVRPAMPARGSALLFRISRSALPAWDQGNGAAQSHSPPDRALSDRHKSHSELSPSIVPRGTWIRRRRNSRVSGRSAGTVRWRQARPLSSNGIPCHRSTCDA